MSEGPDQYPDDELELDWPGDTRVWVEGERLKTFRVALGLQTKSFASAIGTSTTSVNNMERAGRRRTQYGLAICKLLKVTPESLSLPAPPQVIQSPYFRTSAAIKHWEKPKDEATAVSRLVADVADYFDQRVGIDLRRLPELASATRSFHVGSAELSPRAEAAARELRETLDLPPGRVVNMNRVAESAGALVARVPTLRASIHAYATVVGRWNLLLLSASGDYYRERWGVAHELGHLLLHNGMDTADRDVEFEADQFAAELLLPSSEVRSVLAEANHGASLTEYERLKEVWGVSISALLRRARELGCMRPEEFYRANQAIANRGWSRNEPGRMITVELTNTLANAMAHYISFGSSRELIESEVGVPYKIFEACVSRLPIEQPVRPVFYH